MENHHNRKSQFENIMQFSYGLGEYYEGHQHFKGQIVLSEHILYIKGPEADYTSTYVPLEKIKKIKSTRKGLEVHVIASTTIQYTALFKGRRAYLNDLIKDIVQRRGLKKRFFFPEWEDQTL